MICWQCFTDFLDVVIPRKEQNILRKNKTYLETKWFVSEAR